MEYEIESESLLFDSSTNPSLERRAAVRPGATPRAPDRRRPQKAEVIPEEEEQAA